MLDECFGTLEEQDLTDTNIYTLGRVGQHFIATTCLGGQYGTTSATVVATSMMRTFSKSLRVGLIVGIGGGIPSSTNDIRLGDVVVSYPTYSCGGVIQHDMGKIGASGKLTRTGSLKSPPRILLAAKQRNTRTPRNFSQPDRRHDRLFQTQYEHPTDAATCDVCLAEWEVIRDKREVNDPQAHCALRWRLRA
ncbi:uncharacterized protein BDW70DRAFT_169804 [Aspergillus foveolatus]|uniref:uncharacterized protein n=1 Tax=Aspergillus foveolatus TaxID=210207 RepID=UPI003CCC9400